MSIFSTLLSPMVVPIRPQDLKLVDHQVRHRHVTSRGKREIPAWLSTIKRNWFSPENEEFIFFVVLQDLQLVKRVFPRLKGKKRDANKRSAREDRIFWRACQVKTWSERNETWTSTALRTTLKTSLPSLQTEADSAKPESGSTAAPPFTFKVCLPDVQREKKKINGILPT